jgi:NADH-quinone oxidoreductase subunit L
LLEPAQVVLVVAILGPLVSAIVAGSVMLVGRAIPGERAVVAILWTGLLATLLASAFIAVAYATSWPFPMRGEIDFGSWIAIGDYEIPAVFLVDQYAAAFSLLGAVLTALVARFSETYLHKDPGFFRFYVLLGLFAAGTQLLAFAGSLDLFFAGWESIGIASALFIGFFHERAEPVRSAIRAFTTYRMCDVAFLVAIVTTHELIGSTRLADLGRAESLATLEVSAIAFLLLVAAFGKSAQLPFSGWLVRAMEGPTPSSALFYGGISIHAGLYLLLRTAPVLDMAPGAAAFGATVGLLTAFYASAVVRTQADAKGALAQATLAQIGLILAEICLGWTTLALVHLVTHALLRVWQYLRAPNMLHDAHHHAHHAHGAMADAGSDTAFARLRRRLYVEQLHRFRLDDRLDALVMPVLAIAQWLQRLDERWFDAIEARQDESVT